ncbi:recombinase family protein [Methylorubrum thiocyanatum]|uniref:recombinase family protein n=1 Tax=Methylorubrum thiocyanatum TaxID=47958 RepID=UPI00365B2ECA
MSDAHIKPGTVAYSYIRMSTDQQLKGDSLRRQAELSRQWAEQHGLVLDDSLRDIGVSAYKGKNRKEGALGRFLSMVETGRVRPGSYLLVESLDRLSRDQVLEALSLFLEIIRSGIVIVTLADNQTYSQETVGNDWSKLIISLTIMARAHEESQRKSERVSQAYASRLARAWQGEYNMSCAVPYWIDAKRINRDRIEYTLNDHAATIRRMYELAAGGLTRHAICVVFNSESVATLRAGDHGWNAAVINRILDGRESLGEYQAQRRADGKRILVGEPIPGYFPAVVDETLWMAARANKRKTATNRGRKGDRFTNLFIGMGRCVHCNGTMTYHRSTQGRTRLSEKDRAYSRAYFSCSNRRRGKVCPGPHKAFHYDAIERTILDNVGEFRLSEILKIRREASPVVALDRKIAALQLKLEAANRRESNLLNQLEDADEALPLIMARIKERQREKVELEKEISLLDREKIEAELSLVETASEADIRKMRREWGYADDAQAYIMRAKVHAALSSFIDFINFDASRCAYEVVVLNNIRVYRFEDHKLVAKIDLSEQIGPREDGLIDPRVLASNGVDREVRPDRIEAALKLRRAGQEA